MVTETYNSTSGVTTIAQLETTGYHGSTFLSSHVLGNNYCTSGSNSLVLQCNIDSQGGNRLLFNLFIGLWSAIIGSLIITRFVALAQYRVDDFRYEIL